MSDGFTTPAGDPDALHRLADEVDAHAKTVAELSSSTTTTAETVRSAANWTGAAANAYTAFTGGVAQGSGAIPPPLERVSAAIRGYADTLKSAQQRIAAAATTAQQATAGNDTATVDSAKSDAAAAGQEVDKSAEETTGVLGTAVEDLNKIWEKSEPVRGWIEKLHAPWDVVAGDTWLEMAIKKGDSVTEALEKWTKEMPDQIDSWWSEVSSLAHDADNGLTSWDTVAGAADNFTTKASAAAAFTEQWAQDTKWVGTATSIAEGAGRVIGVAGIVGDIGTIIDPPDKGVMGHVDQGVAGVNGALVAANLLTDEIPVVGEVTMIGTGLYLGGDYLYNHWGAFHDVCNTVGHGVATAATTVAHGVADGAKAVGHAASSAWHAATSWL